MGQERPLSSSLTCEITNVCIFKYIISQSKVFNRRLKSCVEENFYFFNKSVWIGGVCMDDAYPEILTAGAQSR